MGCVPGHRILRLARISFPINVAKHGAAERAAGPVVAGQIHIAWESAALHVGARHHVVHVWTIAPHLDRLALLIERRRATDLVVGTMQIGNAGRDDFALRIFPWAVADAIASIDGTTLRSLIGTQIGPPGLVASTRGSGERLSVTVRSLQ